VEERAAAARHAGDLRRGPRRVRALHEVRTQGAARGRRRGQEREGRMNTAGPASHGESATAVAQHRENVVVGDQIVRHPRSARLVHGAVALTFFVCLLTGMPIWSPVFGWMAGFFGGLAVCRWLHPWAGIVFALATMVMTLQWRRDMAFEASE